MKVRRRCRLILLVGLLTGCWLPATLLRAQTQDFFPKPQGYLLPAKQAVPVAKMYDLLRVPVKTESLKKKMSFEDFFAALHKTLPKKWQGVGFVVGAEVYGKDQELIEKVSGGWSAGWKPLDLSLVDLSPKMSVQSALRTALSRWAGEGVVFRLRRGYVQVTTAASAAQVLDCNVHIDLNGPLQDALADLAEESGVSIVLDRRLHKQAQAPVKAKFNHTPGVSLGTILDLLTDMTGLEYVVCDRVVYVTDKANADAFAKRPPSPWLNGDVALADLKCPFAEALERLAAAAEVSIVLDPRLKKQAQRTVQAKFFNGVSLQTALDLLTDMTDTRYVAVGGVA